MSMRNYAVNDYGLLMTYEMMKTVVMKECEDYSEEEYEYDSFGFNDNLYEKGIVEYISDFTGEVIDICDDGTDNYFSSSDIYTSDVIYYVPCRNISTLFKAAYNSIDEMIDEFKGEMGKYFPDDFDYRKYIRHIVGTYYG